MVDIVNTKHITCKLKRANFNYKDEEKALYCKIYKLENVVNIIDRKCIKYNVKLQCYNTQMKNIHYIVLHAN